MNKRLSGKLLTIQTTREMRRRGYHTGKAPFGYTRDKDMHIIKPNHDAHKVRDIFALYDLNCDVDTIATLHDMTVARIRYTLNNPCYYGYIKHNGELVQGVHEPIMYGKRIMYREDDERSRNTEKRRYRRMLMMNSELYNKFLHE